MSKRPWTPGPWKVYAIASENWTTTGDKWDNNRKLASKAPDMAELLIDLASFREQMFGLNSIGCGRIINLVKKADKLLKEIGYEVEE